MAGGGQQPAPLRGMANASVQSFLTVQPSGEGVVNAGADEDFAVTQETDMRDYRDAKAMAKAMREALSERGATITHSEGLEIVAHQFGLSNWNVLSAKIEEDKVDRSDEGIFLEQAVPIVRIFDVEKANEFYLGFLGFTVDWEHRYGDNFPLYMQISRSGLRLHLSEHAGDATPGGNMCVYMTGIRNLHKELQAQDYRYMKPGLQDQGDRVELQVIDPFNNRIRFMELKRR